MRVIAGKFRSRALKALPGRDTRPTSDRLRETLFDVLTAADPSALTGTTWLDLYAGTGAVGIEALSRGADRVVFVDSNRQAAHIIRQNLKSLGIEAGLEIQQQAVLKALPQLQTHKSVFDYIFLDPPYALQSEYTDCLDFLGTSQLLKRESVVIAEHDKRFEPGEVCANLKRYRTLLQGDSALSFYRPE
jgi:16S rRNA (guanine966-N2)-methyltransferase